MLKKIIFISIPVLLIGLIIFNYTYHFNLKDKIPIDTINYVSITGGKDKLNLSIQENGKVKAIYQYIFNRRCKKVNNLFYGNGLPSDGTNIPYILTFLNQTKIYTVVLCGNNYLSINQVSYDLEDTKFDYKYFESLF